MQVARRFEDLAFWQQARELTRGIYALTQKNGFAKDYGLKDQIQRAAVSVMSNIAEGFSRGTNVEFLQFLFIAKGSLSEVQSQLYVALDLAYISQDEFRQVYNKVDQVAKTMNAFIQAVKRTGKSGLKARKEYVSFRNEVERLLDQILLFALLHFLHPLHCSAPLYPLHFLRSLHPYPYVPPAPFCTLPLRTSALLHLCTYLHFSVLPALFCTLCTICI